MMAHWPLFVIAVVLLALSAFVHRANRQNPINRWFAAHTLSITAWTIGIVGLHSGELISFWGRFTFSAASLIPVTFLAFIDHYPRRTVGVRATLRRILWSAAASFAIVSLITPLVLSDIVIIDARPARTTGILYPVFALYFFVAWCSAFTILFAKWRETRGVGRAQLTYLLTATLVWLSGAIATNLIYPFLTGRSTFSWLGPYFGFAFIVLIGHAVIRHRLMDLRIVIHRGLTLAIAVTISLIPVGGLLAIIGPRLSLHLSPSEIGLGLVAILVVALLIPVARDASSRLLDRYVYRKQANYQRTVRTASGELTRVLHLRTLLNFMQGVIGNAVECEGVALYLRRGVILQRGAEERRHPDARFAAPGELPAVLLERLEVARDLIVTDELLRDSRTPHGAELHSALAPLNWALVLPSISENTVIGAIALGPKLSGDPYYPQDFDLLMTLANQAGIAIKNAQLYAQVVLANEYLENIVATIPSGVVAVDPDDVITMFNPAAEQLTGHTHQRVHGQLLAALPRSLSDALTETLRDRVARTQPELDLSDGTVTRPVMCTTSPLRDPDGTLLGAVAVFSDLTPVRELEVERRRVERLAYLETFASGIAHEVKNPLVAIKTFVQLIPRRLEDKRFIEEFTRVVEREIGRMGRLIERLRTLARPGQRPRRLLDVRQPLVDALEFMQASFEEKQVSVEAALGAVEAPVLGDAGELEQLFLNVLMNASEATPPRGRITVAVTRSEGRVVVAVTDTGPGIPVDHLGRVFDPFFTTKERGSGLGLSICAGIADTHGARLRAENVMAGGARFTIEFPLASEVPAPVAS